MKNESIIVYRLCSRLAEGIKRKEFNLPNAMLYGLFMYSYPFNIIKFKACFHIPPTLRHRKKIILFSPFHEDENEMPNRNSSDGHVYFELCVMIGRRR